MLGEVGLQRSSTGWPILWSFRSDDRTAFLRQVRWFSSNHFKQFGRLLTPLVDGLRVRGPFRPLIPELQCADRIVLIDGQGVGHTPETASSVSTRITKRFSEVDLVLIVDTSQHPMQAGPVSLLRAAGSAGYTDKIGVVFTHFDQVRGDNLQTVAQKRAHVIASITNAISSLRQILGAPVAAALERRLSEEVYLLGGLDRDIRSIPKGITNEMRRLLEFIQRAVPPEVEGGLAPIYFVSGLEIALRDAVEGFLRSMGSSPWSGISRWH